tara:strand:- start:291 stop:593 length:303 start_codon:yes stop_codon:yes gene_type:complete
MTEKEFAFLKALVTEARLQTEHIGTYYIMNGPTVLNVAWNKIYNRERDDYEDSDKLIIVDNEKEVIRTKKEIDKELCNILLELEKKISNCEKSFNGYMLI